MSGLMRGFLLLLVVAYGALGIVLFLFPTWSSQNFAWSVSPMVAMTMGGWGLGNAWSALFTWRRPWSTAVGAILYFALFGLIEGAILIAFRANVSLATPLAWLYVGTIVLTALFAVVATVEWIRSRPPLRAVGRPVTAWEFIGAFLFTVLVALLGAYVLTRPALSYGVVFPEPLSAFTVKSFGGLYFSIALATVPLLFLRGLDNYLTYSTAMFGLILFITIAALWFFDRFNLTVYPGQAIYLAAYLVVGAFVVVKVLRHGTGAATAEPAAALQREARLQ